MWKKPYEGKWKQNFFFFNVSGNQESQASTHRLECPEHVLTPPPPHFRVSPGSSVIPSLLLLPFALPAAEAGQKKARMTLSLMASV